MSPDGKPALSAPPDSKKNPKPGKNGNSGRPLFPKSPSLFSLCYLLLEKLSKSLIPLRDCPLRASIASLFFLENLPVSGEKTASDPGFELEAIDGDTSDHEAHEKVDAGLAPKLLIFQCRVFSNVPNGDDARCRPRSTR